nr:Hachiman antiphage defense system protein HamA [Vibrio kanaloae]
MLHKSMDCDDDLLPGKFIIFTPIGVNNSLSYLSIRYEDRDDKLQRAKLVATLERRIKDYKTPNDKGVEYWVDNTFWVNMSDVEHIKSECKLMIIRSAYDDFRQNINPTTHSDSILNDLLVNLIEKSATSIVLYSVDKKTYYREELLEWFEKKVNELTESGSSYSKVYKSNEKPILTKFYENTESYKENANFKKCLGVQGKYHLNVYCYNNVANGIKKWLPEVLLRPRELADNSATNLEEKISRYNKLKSNESERLNLLIPHVLLHSFVRTSYDSQPIPAHLHIDDEHGTTYNNIHIVINRHSPDLLLMGFNYLVEDVDQDSISIVVSDFESLLEQESFDTKKDKILEVKDDSYLPSHDVDEILDSSSALDEHLDRFKFIFFIGFSSKNLRCNKKEMKSGFQDELKLEVENCFKSLIDRLLLENECYSSLNIEVCLYPIPRVDKLISSVKSCLEL